jgi:uridine phosphorylase
VSFPLFPDKIGRPGMLTAEGMLAFRRRHGGLRGVEPPDAVVICLYNGVRRRLSWRYRFSRVRGFIGDLYVVRQRPRRVAVMVGLGMGAPAIANAAEELIAFGTRRLVILSLAGAVRPGLAPGSVVVCDRAVRDEGTSYHYLPPARDVRASAHLVAALDPALVAAGLLPTVGAVWSNDAPYRDTREEAVALAAEGVLAVEMESAGLFAVATVRGAEAASVLVIADSLAGHDWTPPPDMRALHRRMRAVLDALVETLGRTA